jgi:peptide/nickel transport system substrate-binding protein
VGSGPFQFKEWVPGSHITLVRFDGYYGGAPNLDEIVFVVVPDANALALQLQAGEVQGYFGADASQRGMLQKLPGVRLYATPSLLCDHLDFNCETPPLDDARVRRALALATDRDAIATHVYEGLAQPARADVHPLLPWYNPIADTASAYDPARARALLASAGWRDTNGDSIADRDGRPLRLVITTTAGRPDRERTEQVLQQEWKRVGVDLVIRNAVPGVFFGTLEEGGLLRNGKFDVALYSWGQTPDPSGLETVYSSKSVPPAGQNMGRFRNARVDSLTALGARVADRAQRVRIYHDLEAILLHEVPVVPLVWHVSLNPMTDRLHEFRPNATSSGDTWNVRSWWLSPSAP